MTKRPDSTTADRIFSVLDLFTRDRPDWTVEQAANALKTPTSTMYRYFKSLVRSGLLGTFGGGRYILGPTIIRYDRQLRLTDPLVLAARSRLDILAREVAGKGVVFLCRLFDDEVMCVAQASEGNPPFALSYERGRLMPLIAGAASRVILANLPPRRMQAIYTKHADVFLSLKIGATWPEARAHLADVRERVALATLGEVDRGNRGLSAPVLLEGSVLGSLSIAGPRANFDGALIERLLQSLRAATLEIERDLHATLSRAL